jgi:hypothetical protein
MEPPLETVPDLLIEVLFTFKWNAAMRNALWENTGQKFIEQGLRRAFF